MSRPTTVRIGLGFLVVALILRGAILIVPLVSRVHSAAIDDAVEAVSLVIYTGFVYGMAEGRNWPRLVFAFLYVASAVLGLVFGPLRPYLGRFDPDFTGMYVPQVSSLGL